MVNSKDDILFNEYQKTSVKNKKYQAKLYKREKNLEKMT